MGKNKILFLDFLIVMFYVEGKGVIYINYLRENVN